MLICCGDSHTRPFDYNLFEHQEDDPIFQNMGLVWKPGDTAAGFARKNPRRHLREALTPGVAYRFLITDYLRVARQANPAR